MRSRSLFTLLLLVLGLAGCARLTHDQGIRALAGQDILLGSTNEVVSLDAGSGVVRFQATGIPALGSWSKVFTTTQVGSTSMLRAQDASSGQTLSTIEVPRGLEVRVASSNGSFVALMEPLPEGASPWIPEPRATTTIVVADPSGTTEPRSFQLEGNYEPEAFSWNGSQLYLISYVPPTAPDAYRVARLDTSSGKVHLIGTGIKGVIETMSGTRLEQVVSPDESMLHTLYSTAPAAYATHADHGQTVSFVHMLSLDGRWAHCLALPKPMWGGDAEDQAMAVSPDGEYLYVVDSAQGLVTEVETRDPGINRTVAIELGSTGDAATQATVTPNGRLLISTGTRIVELDSSSFERVRAWNAPDDVLALGADASNLFVALPGRIQVLDGRTMRPLGSLASPTVEEIAYVGAAGEESSG